MFDLCKIKHNKGMPTCNRGDGDGDDGDDELAKEGKAPNSSTSIAVWRRCAKSNFNPVWLRPRRPSSTLSSVTCSSTHPPTIKHPVSERHAGRHSPQGTTHCCCVQASRNNCTSKYSTKYFGCGFSGRHHTPTARKGCARIWL